LEINTSFYGPPKPQTTRAWLHDIEGNPRFRFTSKLWRGFTHERNAKTEDEKLVKEGLDPLVEARRLGALLLQFPWSFRHSPDNRQYLIDLQRRFREYPLVLEVRHASWADPEILEFLAELNVGLCNIDQPLFAKSIKPGMEATSPVGYVRLHGRNYQTWFSVTANVRERYDYLYTVEELEPWVDRVREIAKKTEDVYVVTNNHNVGQAPANALELAAILGGGPVAAPPILVEHYPVLNPYVKKA
jgi:uncharacterized protein YecE (DUF72 family)